MNGYSYKSNLTTLKLIEIVSVVWDSGNDVIYVVKIRDHSTAPN